MRGLKRVFGNPPRDNLGGGQRSRPGDAGIETAIAFPNGFDMSIVREAAPAMRGLKQ